MGVGSRLMLGLGVFVGRDEGVSVGDAEGLSTGLSEGLDDPVGATEA